jgi:hypothetical protein
MAEGKNTIVVYRDWINIFEKFTDLEAGVLIKHFFRYVNDLNPNPPDRLTVIAFEPIRLQLKRDLMSWEETRVKRSMSGRLGGLKSGEARKQNEANASCALKNEANEAVIVTDTVTVTVTDIKKEKNKKRESGEKIASELAARSKKFYDSLIPFSSLYPPKMLREFYEYWIEPNKSKTKMRLELERTWDTERRLKTWAAREKVNQSSGNVGKLLSYNEVCTLWERGVPKEKFEKQKIGEKMYWRQIE